MIYINYIGSTSREFLLTPDLPNSLRLLLIKLVRLDGEKMSINRLLDHLNCEKQADFFNPLRCIANKDYACSSAEGKDTYLYISFLKEEIRAKKSIIQLCNRVGVKVIN